MIKFDLPKELIAQEPARPRDSARLLVYDRTSQTITNSVFSDLPKYLNPSTTLVLNNSRVEHCRWLFDNGRVELFILEKLDSRTIRALVRPGKKFKINTSTTLNDWLEAETTAIDHDGIRTIRLNIDHNDPRLSAIEHIPLPPYIKQNDHLANEYQTIYSKISKNGGSKAAPTAGLHFTTHLIESVKKSHQILEVTLHVGLGTFVGLTEDNYKSGKLHSESYEIKPSVAHSLADAKHITAVGTTTSRTLESWQSTGKIFDDTNIFIRPGYKFKMVDSLITNFHLPGTSLLLMIEALIGSESETQRIYNHAIDERYRFYSFGDGMIII